MQYIYTEDFGGKWLKLFRQEVICIKGKLGTNIVGILLLTILFCCCLHCAFFNSQNCWDAIREASHTQ